MAIENPSNDILCCGARSWVLVIGWMQTISSIISMVTNLTLFFAVSTVVLVDETNQQPGFVVTDPNGERNLTVTDKEKELILETTNMTVTTLLVLLIFSDIIQLFAGITLIVGVKQRDLRKVNVWYFIETFFLIFAILGLAIALTTQTFPNSIDDICLVLLNLFFLWVVNIYRLQLLRAGSGQAPSVCLVYQETNA